MHTMNPRTIHTAFILLLFVFGVITTGFILLGGSSDQLVEEVDAKTKNTDKQYSGKKDHFILTVE